MPHKMTNNTILHSNDEIMKKMLKLLISIEEIKMKGMILGRKLTQNYPFNKDNESDNL